MKNQIKGILIALNLLQPARKIRYWLTQFNPYTTHPRRVMVNFYSKFLNDKGDLCFDIGANLGQRTDIFLELGAKVIAVEPQSKCIEKLQSSFGKNSDVIIVNRAVGEQEGESEISICEDLSSISTMSQSWQNNSVHAKEYGYKWTKVEKVQVTTLDILISQYGLPKFCKIDVEGFEYQVLQGLNQQIPTISFEFNPDFLLEMKKCCDRLSEIGNYKFNFAIAEPSGGEGLILTEWVDPETLYQKIITLKQQDSKIWGDVYAKIF